MRSKLLLLMLPFLLSACMIQSKIQGRYVREHDECTEQAEDNIDKYLPKDRTVSVEDRNAGLVTIFSDCMAKKGWQVARPAKAPPPTTGNSIPPTPSPAAVVPVQQGTLAQPQAAAMPPPTTGNSIPPGPSPAAAMAPAQPAPLTPPPAAPAPQPAPADGAASYQPEFGTGPGRNF
jgi:hypothetical protein